MPVDPSRVDVVVIAAFLASAASVLAGPYRVTLPVQGLDRGSLPALETALRAEVGDRAYRIAQSRGVLHFGAKPEGFLRLSDLVGAVGEAGLKVDTASWMLKPQGLAIQVSCERARKDTALDELIAAFPEARIRVIGRLQEQERTCIVLRLSDSVDYTAFRKYLSAQRVQLRDIVWAHWDLVWGFDYGEHVPHEMGMYGK